MSLADELRKLMQLHAEGGLTDQEFTEAKAAVTQQTASGASAQNTKPQAPSVAAPLIDAAQAGDDANVTAIISHFIDGTDGLGWTALHHAIAGGHDVVVESLIAAKADVNQAGRYDARTPLMEAAATGSTGICMQLLTAGADPQRKDNIGRTAVDIAKQGGHSECAATLEPAR